MGSLGTGGGPGAGGKLQEPPRLRLGPSVPGQAPRPPNQDAARQAWGFRKGRPPQPRKHSQTGSQQSLGPGVPREDPWAYGTRRHPSHGWARGPRGLGRGASWGAVSVTVRSDKIAQSLAACDYLLEANGCFNINRPQAAFGERRPEPWPGCLRRQEVPPPPHGANTDPGTARTRPTRRLAAQCSGHGRTGRPARAPGPERPVHTTRPRLTQRRAPAPLTPADSSRRLSTLCWCSGPHRARLPRDVPDCVDS